MPSTNAGETPPERIDKAGDKRAMASKFLFARKMGPRRTRFANYHPTRSRLSGHAAGVGNKSKADLASTGELDIDLGEELRVEQRAVFYPIAAVDSEAHAQSVQAVLSARM